MNRFIPCETLPDKMILTDDPLRIQMLAAHYLDHAEKLFELRGMTGYRGVYKGKPLAVIACGYGESAAACYLNEAVRLGARDILYIGECLALERDIGLMSVITAEGGDGPLTKRVLVMAETIPMQIRLAPVDTDDRFWLEEAGRRIGGSCRYADFATRAFHDEARKLGVSACAILTVAENAASGERLPEAARQSRFSGASILALEAL